MSFHLRVQRYGWDLAVDSYDHGWGRLLTPHAAVCVDRAGLRPGDRVLDAATGTGAAAFLAAERVGPGGEVVGADISEKMVARATERAAANTRFVRTDLESPTFDDASFDAALCAFGLMYAADPALALRQLARVLRPGGRLAVCVWGPRTACGWHHVFPIIAARVRSEVCPLFFALGAPGALAAELTAAGFTDVSDQTVTDTLTWPDGAAACRAILAGGPVALAYEKFSPEVRAEVDAELLDALSPYRAGDGYQVPATFVHACATR
jgi:ubiquinone/menaquinone biosynthesis C-methylase UbiE